MRRIGPLLRSAAAQQADVAAHSSSSAGRDGPAAAEKGVTVLERLLALLSDGAPHTLTSLAADLGTTPALVEAMVADLAQRGLLRERSASCCAGHCAGCPAAGGCTLGRIWETRG